MTTSDAQELVAAEGHGFVHAMLGSRRAGWHALPLHKLVIPLDRAILHVDDGRICGRVRRPLLVPQGVAQHMLSDGPSLAVFAPAVDIDGRGYRLRCEERINAVAGPLGGQLCGLAAEAVHAGLPPEGVSALIRVQPHLWGPADLEPRVVRVATCVAERPATRIPLARLASAAGLSTSRLSHLFRSQTGVSLRAYASYVRARHAALALLAGEQDLASVAADSGFSDQAHLTRMCSRHFGRTPAVVRSQMALSSAR